MNVIKLLSLFTFLIISAQARAVLKVDQLVINCGETQYCQKTKIRLETLKDTYRNTTHLRQTLKVVVSMGGFRNFHWELNEKAELNTLTINFFPKNIIGSIQVKSSDPLIKEYVERNIKIKSSQWFEDDLLDEETLRLRQYLASKGYPRSEINYNTKTRDNETNIVIDIEPGIPQVLEDIKVTTNSETVRKFATQKFEELKFKNYDVQLVRTKADELELELFSYGYFLTTVTLTPKKKGDNVVLEALIAPVEQWVFDIVQPPPPAVDVKMEFGPIVRELFRRYRRPIDESTLKVGIKDSLKKNGYLNSDIKLTLSRYKNSQNDWVNHSKVEIFEGVRTRVREVHFVGSNYFNERKLKKMWEEQASELSGAGFYDEESNKNFANWLKNQYIQLGFVRASIEDPRVSYGDDPTSANLEYTVVEGSRVFVDEIKFSGLTDQETTEIAESLKTKQGNFFNPIAFAEDIKLITDTLQDLGWYNAEVYNRDADDIVNYGKDTSSVKIDIKIRKGKRITFNRHVLVGNRDTRNKVLRRKSPFNHGDPITPNKVKEYENNLNSTGLFTTVRVKPIFHKGDTPLTDLAVEVVERDFGLIEIAPGFRTDIGMKLSGTVSFLNLLGENISTSLTGQVNQRVNTQAFDARRASEGKSLLEYNVTAMLNVPDVSDTYVNYGIGLTVQRRRFFSFDADIRRISNTLSRDFGSKYSVSLRHQFESINQFDATENRDNGSFEIGAITPSFTADYRNTRINPTAGAWFNISNEIANPLLLSQQKKDLTINFYKLISRNRFYIPIPRGTIAVSMVGGVEENLAKKLQTDSAGNPVIDPQSGQKQTEGYIPNIKIFRLTGLDIVRGFSDREINRLPNGKDIGDDRVQDKAYMANFKLEPRYFINDSLMAGVFFDAGRVYKDSVNLSDLRQSVGVTFKVVTPVGTLDFDYGFKLLRKRDADGNLEAPGRFHVSIGFF
ncbi:MAG: BamA/TamA family outer membrane protein [Bacteriovoracaceae bacterium]|nr:BamA/TamA family outer membrane protein [Bacteriovoracaceae bacterium]